MYIYLLHVNQYENHYRQWKTYKTTEFKFINLKNTRKQKQHRAVSIYITHNFIAKKSIQYNHMTAKNMDLIDMCQFTKFVNNLIKKCIWIPGFVFCSEDKCKLL